MTTLQLGVIFELNVAVVGVFPMTKRPPRHSKDPSWMTTQDCVLQVQSLQKKQRDLAHGNEFP